MNENTVTSLLFREFPYEPTHDQQSLIMRLGKFITASWNNPTSLFVLKGYAGTGKTTVVTALVNVLPQIKKRSVLLAPTGRAAKVLASYSKKPANTIHRKIYFARTTKDGSIALKLQLNLHKETLFIVDEASMIQNSSMNDFSLFSGKKYSSIYIMTNFSTYGGYILLEGRSEIVKGNIYVHTNSQQTIMNCVCFCCKF